MEDFIYKILEGYNTYIDEWYKDSYADKTIVTINEIIWQDIEYADDDNTAVDHSYQFDIWGKDADEVKKISKEVYKILKDNDFICTDGATLNEYEKGIYRKSLRFDYTEYIK